jgi:glycerophosphoryl diester phosphodiesterase
MGSVIGHRGAAGYAPENTIASFEKAYQLGCRCIEFDVMLSADEEAFIIHDEHLSRTTNGKGDVGQVSAAYMRGLDAGRWFSEDFKGEKIPTLQESIDWLILKDMKANIEIKPYPHTAEKTTRVVIKLIEEQWPKHLDFPLISSFDVSVLELSFALAPSIPRGLLLHRWRHDWRQLAARMCCFSVHLNSSIVTKTRIHLIKAEGYQVYVYTVNKRHKAALLFELGVDAVFTDFPDLLQVSTS